MGVIFSWRWPMPTSTSNSPALRAIAARGRGLDSIQGSRYARRSRRAALATDRRAVRRAANGVTE